MSYIDDLEQAAAEALAASSSATDSAQIMADVANGDENTTVTTANGEVKTLAKAIKDIIDTIEAGVEAPQVEPQTLSTGQTTVTLSTMTTEGIAVYVEGSREFDFTVVNSTDFEFGESFPDGTRIWVVKRDIEGVADSFTVNTATGSQTLSNALDNRVIYVDTIADLQALDASGLVDGQGLKITTTGRTGDFVVRVGDFSTEVTSDPESGVWVPFDDDPNGDSFVAMRLYEGPVYTSWFGSIAETDITSSIKGAQTYLSSVGGGRITIDIDGWATIADLTVDATYSDYAIDVSSNIEINAYPGFELRADKTKGSDNAGYAIFRIFEGVENVKIHGFHNINGIDKDTVKGIGQIVAIRGETDTARSRNINIWDIGYNDIRDEPFRLGQTSFAGQITENVNIWDIRGDGSISHGVVMRSVLNGHASGLKIKRAGRLAIDISSYCINCHLNDGRGVNEFIDTRGGAKIDGGSNNIDCSIGDYYYDGSTTGSNSTDGFAFRLVGVRAEARNIFAKNCGGAGFNCLVGSMSAPDMRIRRVHIDGVTNGDGTSGTFDGRPFVLTKDSAGDLNLEFEDVVINGAVSDARMAVDGVSGNLSIDGSNLFIYNGTYKDTQAKNINLTLSLNNSEARVIKDSTNGGGDNLHFTLSKHEGDSELIIENSTNVNVTANAAVRGTRTRQITINDCPDFHVHDIGGSGSTMIGIFGTVQAGLVSNIKGTYSAAMIDDSTATVGGKALYTDSVNNGSGDYNISAGATQANLI